METFDPIALRKALGSFMTGVTIVTAKADDGSLVGFTANSFTSVSMDPPLLLVCPGNHLSSIDVFRNCKNFVVNILHEDQQDLSNKFARFEGDRFSQVDWKPDHNGVPLITGSLASFSCSAYQKTLAGDHLVLIGKIEKFISSDGDGLGYWKGGYFSFSKEREARVTSNAERSIVVGAIVEAPNGIFVLQEDGKLILPSKELVNKTQARIGISNFLQDINLPSDVGRVYSIYHDASSQVRNIYFRANCKNKHAPESGTFVDADKVMNTEWYHSAEKIMVQRYFAERNTNQFGLYIGDSDTGEIHHEIET